MRCDCGEQLRGAICRMAEDGAGVLLYLAQEGRGIGLVNKLRAYGLQDRGLDTMDANRVLGWGADERNFLVGATMLRLMGINRVRLLTNNPDKMDAMIGLWHRRHRSRTASVRSKRRERRIPGDQGCAFWSHAGLSCVITPGEHAGQSPADPVKLMLLTQSLSDDTIGN